MTWSRFALIVLLASLNASCSDAANCTQVLRSRRRAVGSAVEDEISNDVAE